MTERLGRHASARGNGRRGAWRRRDRFARALIACIAVGGAALPTAAWSAGETPHEIVWAHANPASVSRFVVFVSAVKGNSAAARRVDVGKPSSAPSGSVQIFSAIVPIQSAEFVAVAAVGHDGRMGALSSWSGVPPTRPGQPIVIEP